MATLAPPPDVARQIQPWIWRLQALLAAYLPLLLMAFLAATSWWLVKNSPLAEAPLEAVPLRHEPDYRMSNFELQRVAADGRLRVRVEGSELRHYPDTDTLEVDGIRLQAYGADRSLTLATARRAISNADASEIQLLGEVKLQRFGVDARGALLAQPLLEVRGEFLRAQANTERLGSHLPVQLSYAGGELRAQSFEYDHLRGQLNLAGRVAGQFAARAGARK